LKFLSGIALALTAVGLFAVLAFTVDQRMSEFGVRQALGASPRDLISLVVRASMFIVTLGVGLGLFGAVALSQYLRSLLFEVPPYDPVVLGTVAAVVMLSGLVASVVPAARAAKADIVKLLRTE
jgi:putative ABC transport system permease protein